MVLFTAVAELLSPSMNYSADECLVEFVSSLSRLILIEPFYYFGSGPYRALFFIFSNPLF